MKNIIIRTIDMNSCARAFTILDNDGDYNIYINAAMSYEQQRKSLDHERRHIERGDFFSFDDAISIEGAM